MPAVTGCESIAPVAGEAGFGDVTVSEIIMDKPVDIQGVVFIIKEIIYCRIFIIRYSTFLEVAVIHP